MQETKNITVYRMQLKEHIVDTAMRAFAAKGIRAVKMDDIAQQLSISKRTLYEIYDNKEDLLYEGVRKFRAQKDQQLKQMMDDNCNVMDVILQAYRQKVEEFRKTVPQFYSDIARYPRVLSLLEEDHERNREQFLDFLLRGVKEGYFRQDVDYELVSMVFDALGNYIIQNQLYKQYTIEDIFKNLIFVSLRGFCTSKGVASLDDFLAANTTVRS